MSGGINKSIPQVQPMSEKEDLQEFFQLFESTQQARHTPKEAYAATLLPLLNPVCKSLALSLPAESRTSYSILKRELLAQADSRSDATVQVFWEHRKPKGTTWREEAATLTKLARRCATSNDPEQVRQIFVMEQLTQQLPKSIQMYVRERKPSTLDQLLDLVLTYFRAHHLDETAWEPKENFTPKKKQVTLSSHDTSTKATKTDNDGSYAAHSNTNDHITDKDSRHKPADSSRTYRYPRKDIKDIQCYNCKEMGHYSWQCVKVNIVALPGCDSRGKPPGRCCSYGCFRSSHSQPGKDGQIRWWLPSGPGQWTSQRYHVIKR